MDINIRIIALNNKNFLLNKNLQMFTSLDVLPSQNESIYFISSLPTVCSCQIFQKEKWIETALVLEADKPEVILPLLLFS